MLSPVAIKTSPPGRAGCTTPRVTLGLAVVSIFVLMFVLMRNWPHDQHLPWVNPSGHEGGHETRVGEIVQPSGPGDAALPIPATQPSPLQPFELTVLGENHKPLVSASAHIQDHNGSWSVIGKTNESGVLSLPCMGEDDPPPTGWVAHRDHVTADFQFSDKSRSQTLILASGGVITGTVTGAPHGSSIRVIAFDSALPDSTNRLSECLDRHPRSHQVCVHPDGSFRIGSLPVNRIHTVAAYGHNGYGPMVHVQPGTQASPAVVDIPYRILYGCLLRFESMDGLPLQRERRLSLHTSRPFCAPNYQVMPPGFTGAPDIPSQVSALLSGRTTMQTEEGVYTETRFLTPHPNAQSMPPPPAVPFRIHLPGYEPLVGAYDFQLPDPAIGYPVHSFKLTPTGREFGEVKLEIDGTQYLEAFGGARLDFAEYQLQLSQPEEQLNYDIKGPLSLGVHLKGIPHGTYKAHFTAQGRSISEGPVDLVVGDEPSTVRFDVSRYGSIHLHVLNEDGSPYRSGHVAVSMVRGFEPSLGRIAWHTLMGEPYIIRHLNPGPYYMLLEIPEQKTFRALNPGGIPDTIHVTESFVTEATIQLGPE